MEEENKPIEEEAKAEEVKPAEEVTEEVKPVEEPKKENFLTKKKEVKGKPLKIWIIVMIIIFMLFTFGIGFTLGKKLTENDMKSKENNKPVEEKKEENKPEENKPNNTSNLDFDFDAMQKDLQGKLQSGSYKANRLSCTETPAPEGELPIIDSQRTLVSDGTIEIVIDKLKTAKSLDKNVTAGWIGECYPRSTAYIISVDSEVNTDEFQNNKVFTLYYADADNILLVGYEGIGYAFNFESSEEINNFIESLN